MNQLFTIRPLTLEDRNWVAYFMDRHWGSTTIVSRGRVIYGHLLPGYVAEMIGAPADAPAAGLLTYDVTGDSCEIVTLNSLEPRIGIGTALLDTLKGAAYQSKIRRLWLITTNDNLDALRFYQRRGFNLANLYVDAIIQARKLKPQIALIGRYDIPIRDEIELEYMV